MNDTRKLIAALVAALIGLGVTVAITDDDDGHGHKSRTVTIHVDGVDADRKADDAIKAPAELITKAARATDDQDLRDETPAAAERQAPAKLDQVQKTEARVKASKDPLPTAGASQGFPGCRTSFVRNQSSRNGVRPIWQVNHYTVSPNRPGWSDVDAIIGLFNRSSSQASSHFVIDGEGHCAYIVPIEAKSWTEAAGNSLSVGYEIINSGSERAYLAAAGLKRLRQVQRAVAARTGIPLRQGSVYPARAGIVQHKDGGLPWGGHHDIAPFPLGPVVHAVTKLARVKIARRDRHVCARVRAYRVNRKRLARRHKTPAKKWTALYHRRLARERGRGLRCVNGKVKRR